MLVQEVHHKSLPGGKGECSGVGKFALDQSLFYLNEGSSPREKVNK